MLLSLSLTWRARNDVTVQVGMNVLCYTLTVRGASTHTANLLVWRRNLKTIIFWAPHSQTKVFLCIVDSTWLHHNINLFIDKLKKICSFIPTKQSSHCVHTTDINYFFFFTLLLKCWLVKYCTRVIHAFRNDIFVLFCC